MDTARLSIIATLKLLTSDGDAYTHVLTHESTQDGRNAWITLCAFYEGPALMSITTEEACLKLEPAWYTGGNKGFTFQKYLTTHLQAYVLMEQNPALSTTYSEFHKKDLILKGIKCPNLKTVVEIARAKQEWTFAQIINYLRSLVTNHELNRAHDGEEHQVHFTQSGRGGGGRGGGRKRGK